MYKCFCIQVRTLITYKPSSITAEEGQNVSLPCKATGLPLPGVTWRKACSKLPVKRSSIVNGNLSIRSITKADSRNYACSEKNLLGDDFAVAVVMVIERLQFILTLLNKVTVTLHCTVRGQKRSSGKEWVNKCLKIMLFIQTEPCF